MKRCGWILSCVCLWGSSCWGDAAPNGIASAASARDQSLKSLEESSPFAPYREKVVPTSTLSFLSVCQYQRKNGVKYYEFTLKDSLEKKEFTLRSDRTKKGQKYSFNRYDVNAKTLVLKNNQTGKLVSVRQTEQKVPPKTSGGATPSRPYYDSMGFDSDMLDD